MRSGQHPRNLLLQALPAAEFEALRPRLELVELVKDTVLVEAGAPLTLASSRGMRRRCSRRPSNRSHAMHRAHGRSAVVAVAVRVRELSDSETLPLTQEFLAQMIGVQRNAVSIVAHALQKAGMIRYSRGHIEITDADRLLETTCECYRAVKAKRDRLLKPPN
jgi:CRP-like cAMP-binding protein